MNSNESSGADNDLQSASEKPSGTNDNSLSREDKPSGSNDSVLPGQMYTVSVRFPQSMGEGDEVGSKVASAIDVIDQVARASLRILAVVALAAVVYWTASDPQFFRDWMDSLTSAEAFGFRFQRSAIEEAETELRKVIASDKDVAGDAQRFSEAAIARAVFSADAIVGANVLWVDDEPSNNLRLRGVLETLRINVAVARSTDEALAAARLIAFDLVVSDVWRANDIGESLANCRVHYFDFPDVQLETEFRQRAVGTHTAPLALFNEAQNQRGPAGYYLAERLLTEQAELRKKPRIVFYAGTNAGISRSLCGDGITNRADHLLQKVVSILEEERWYRLKSP